MIKYKLTDQDMRTHGGYQWSIGEPKRTDGRGELCGPGWLHYYHHPLLAVLLNPIHAGISEPRLWEVQAEGMHLDDSGLKGGCTSMTIVRELPLPTVTDEQRVRFGILCALTVYSEPGFARWAEDWLSGKNRSRLAARAAALAASVAWATAYEADATKDAAAWVAWAADAAADAAGAAEAAGAARAARAAARAVARAARAAGFGLVSLAIEATEGC